MAKEPKQHWYLREWMAELGRTQEEVREQAGISKGRMSDLVSCKERWNEDHLTRFAEILGIERWQLLDVDPTKKSGATITGIFEAVRRVPAQDREKALRAAQSVVESFASDKKA